MLKFNELRIDSATKNLIIDASVIDMTDDPNHLIGINSIRVGIGTNTTSELLDDFRPQAESGGAWVDVSTSPIYERIDGDYNVMRGFRISLNLSSYSEALCLDATKQLIYVRVEVEVPAALAAVIPCSYKRYIEGHAYDRCVLYNPLFDYLKASDGCGDKTLLANYIAQIKGLELATETSNFTLANKYWNKFFINNNISTNTTGCGCH